MFIFGLISVVILGLIIGSFVGALTWRLPRNLSIAKGRSFCPKCKNKIAWYDNIPLFSFIALQGKCRHCKKKISCRYPLVEFSTSAVFAFIYLIHSNCQSLLNSAPICFFSSELKYLSLPYLLLVSSILIAVFVVDLEHQYIYDWMVLTLFVVSVILIILINPDSIYTRMFSGFFVASFLVFLHYATKGKGMGLGDAKLVLFGGLILDWKLSILWISFSFIIGAIVGLFLIAIRKASFGKTIPFGPFIVVSFFIMLLFGNNLLKTFLPYL